MITYFEFLIFWIHVSFYSRLTLAGPFNWMITFSLSCDTPSSPYGLFINLTTFGSVGWDFLPLDSTRTASPLYLQIRKIWKSKILAESLQPPSGVPTKLAIGVEGGWATTIKEIKRLYMGGYQRRQLYFNFQCIVIICSIEYISSIYLIILTF